VDCQSLGGGKGGKGKAKTSGRKNNRSVNLWKGGWFGDKKRTDEEG